MTVMNYIIAPTAVQEWMVIEMSVGIITILCIIIPVYIIGVIVTTLICYKLDTDDEDVIGIAWFWPACLALIIIFGILWLPVGIYKLLNNKSSKSNDKIDYYDDYDKEYHFEFEEKE